MSNKGVQELNLEKMLSQDKYKIPVYQRNYDWGNAQIKQLIDDIQDFFDKDDQSTYYLGSLVVHQQDSEFEVLDGQQRFTTLVLLACYLKYRFSGINSDMDWYKGAGLRFESRPKSDRAINDIFSIFSKSNSSSTLSSSESFSNLLVGIDPRQCNASIVEGFKVIARVVSVTFTDDSELIKFTDYLLKNVKILRVCVPKNTDVTHYFEVMNNRGEQLEKHEIVKANLLSAVKGEEQVMAAINKVWLACSDMGRYVQAGFSVTDRKNIFGSEAGGFLDECFVYLFGCIESDKDKKNTGGNLEGESWLSLGDSIKEGKVGNNKDVKNKKGKGGASEQDDGRKERFKSVINFPNFLMHVLRNYLLNEEKGLAKKDLPSLDDKELIQAFKKHIGKDHSKVKEFIFTLLKTRYLFDRYVIKQDGNDGNSWSLRRYKLYEGNSSNYVDSFNDEEDHQHSETLSCLMLLSAFHVSYPGDSRKNWLSAVLYWLGKQDREGSLSVNSYQEFLENLAKTFMVKRYLTSNQQEYKEFIYQDLESSGLLDELETPGYRPDKYLTYGSITVFVFNYLDYLLWKKGVRVNDERASEFRFSSKSTAEHFSPQDPKANERLEEGILHSFGNLCLMSASENSSLSNDGPEQKAKILIMRRDKMAPLSLKLELMMEQAQSWDADVISEHGKKMWATLEAGLGLSKDEA